MFWHVMHSVLYGLLCYSVSYNSDNFFLSFTCSFITLSKFLAFTFNNGKIDLTMKFNKFIRPKRALIA